MFKDWSTFVELTFAGLTRGSLYALVALGYTLVYGILELINFAHGDVFMIGGMIAATFVINVFALSPYPGIGMLALAVVVSLAVAMAGCALLNATIERIGYRPLRGAPRLVPLITAIGMSYILENIAFVWKGPRPVSLPPTLPSGDAFTIGTCPKCASYQWSQLFVLIVTVPVLVGLVWLVRYTKRGKAMRATAQDKDAAAMMGIDVNRTISFTFLVAGALAGAAGVIFAFYQQTMQFNTGFTLGLIAFTAAVLGGIGNLQGAVLGGLMIGFIQDFNEGLGWQAPGSAWTHTIVFGILILTLVFRPQGLLGEQIPEGG
ncbi:MAG: branched-chain amino acid ABC transporter permease [Actinobacteria bacterium]|nr:MAG: branched-chain amino acid ABC transporter permease [Actinomycetota bacterium]